MGNPHDLIGYINGGAASLETFEPLFQCMDNRFREAFSALDSNLAGKLFISMVSDAESHVILPFVLKTI
jgi:hypothetical protein